MVTIKKKAINEMNSKPTGFTSLSFIIRVLADEELHKFSKLLFEKVCSS